MLGATIKNPCLSSSNLFHNISNHHLEFIPCYKTNYIKNQYKMAMTNIFKRRQRRILNTSVNDAFSTQRSNRDNSEVPSSIQLSQSEDESSAKLNSDEDTPTTSSTSKSNSDEDKPPTPLKKKGITDRFARDCRQGFKELGGKVGKNLKEGMLVAGDKVGKNIKEGVKEAGEKAGDRVKEGLITVSDKFFALILIINFTWLGFFIWLNH